jgi:ATP-dependent DNA helicase RecG
MTAPELAKVIGISPRKIEQNVASLKKIGQLRRIGSRKAGYWEVVE